MGNARNLIIWIALFILVIGLFNVFNSTDQTQTGAKISFSEFMQRVDNGTVSRVVLDGEKVFIKASDGGNFQTVKPIEVDVTR
ncbi:MAG: ATP-dependent metallopeptidase FtsH/Yme1/Tma family protein, partial [Amylibacter sp.]